VAGGAKAVEHYEITRYSSLIAWANRLGRPISPSCSNRRSKKRRRPTTSLRRSPKARWTSGLLSKPKRLAGQLFRPLPSREGRGLSVLSSRYPDRPTIDRILTLGKASVWDSWAPWSAKPRLL